MDSEAFESAARDLLDLNFQSLAMKHIDLKQMELDTAAAKVDELTKQLESLWSDSPAPATPPPHSSAPTRLTRYSSSPTPDHFSRTSSPRKVADSGDATYSRSENSPALHPYIPLSPKGRPASPRTPLYLSPESYSPLERAPSPRPKTITFETGVSSLGRAPSPRPGSGPLRPTGPPPQYDFLGGGRAGSPRGDGSQAFFPDHRGPSPRLSMPATYEGSTLFGSPPPGAGGSAFAPLRAQDDLTLRRRPKTWNESDLDVAYEKKSSSQTSNYDRLDVFGGLRPSSPALQLLPWRESSLDGLGGPGKDSLTSSTLPRNYKVSPLASDRRTEVGGYRRSLGPGLPGTLPRSWQPASRIAMPPTSPQTRGAPRQRPIPLSMIFKLQNAFWEYGAAKAGPPGSPIITRAPLPKLTPQVPASVPAPQSPVLAPQSPVPAPLSPAQPVPPARPPGGEGPPKLPEEPEPEPELEVLLAPALEAVETEEGAVPRPLSPTRLQPALPPEAQTVPELEEVARVLAEIPRPLKRRGSMEQSPGPALPPTHKKQYQQIINRLFHRHGSSGGGGGGGPPRDGAIGSGGPEPELPPITEGSEARAGPPAPAPPAPTLLPSLPDPPTPQSTEMRSVLRKGGSPRKARRARLNPLVLLLDAALTGELDVVQQAVKEMNDPSQPNEEGITALHNAICGANYAIVDFLIGTGANVNSPDSHGWTPLHCAASCNDTAICTALVQHGAAIFATTLSDGAMAIEKCDPYREGYADCATYLAEAEQSMGHLHGGAVYALWDYSAEFGDELSFREGEPVTVLRRDGPEETDWWWAALRGQEGYVPRNYFGLFPRVKPQRGKV